MTLIDRDTHFDSQTEKDQRKIQDKHGLTFLISPFHTSLTIIGDQKRFFKTDSCRVGDFVFLRIRTRTGNQNEVLNRERQSQYRLTVKAVGKWNNNSDWEIANGGRGGGRRYASAVETSTARNGLGGDGGDRYQVR